MKTRIKRSSSDKFLAGVCGGFAEHFGWDPTIVRILYLVLVFSSFGSMALLYLILVWIMPKESGD
ncbi:MAG: PspC domain-containing protein [Balneolaceae bacterium]